MTIINLKKKTDWNRFYAILFFYATLECLCCGIAWVWVQWAEKHLCSCSFLEYVYVLSCFCDWGGWFWRYRDEIIWPWFDQNRIFWQMRSVFRWRLSKALCVCVLCVCVLCVCVCVCVCVCGVCVCVCLREAGSVPPCQLLPHRRTMHRLCGVCVCVCVSCGSVSLPRAGVLQLWHLSLASLLYNCCVCDPNQTIQRRRSTFSQWLFPFSYFFYFVYKCYSICIYIFFYIYNMYYNTQCWVVRYWIQIQNVVSNVIYYTFYVI